MTLIKFTIPGEPQAQKRHRDRKYGGKYDPSVKAKKEFRDKCMEYKPLVPFDGPIALTVHCYFSRPKSHYRTGKFSGELKDTAPEFHIVKPDGDNLLKFVGDALSGVFWTDDRIIWNQIVMKGYSTVPKTEICIYPQEGR